MAIEIGKQLEHVLHYFKNFLKNVNEEKKHKEILQNYNLKTEEEFKSFVLEQLEAASQVKDKHGLQALEDLLVLTIKPCLMEQDLEFEKELQVILQNKAAKNKEELLKELLLLLENKVLKHEANKMMLLQKLWEAYFADQNSNLAGTIANKFLRANKSAFDSFVGQTQADPLKRSGMFLFEALYAFFDFITYSSSNGKNKLSSNTNEVLSEEEAQNGFGRNQQALHGSPYAGMMAAPKLQR